MYLYMHIYIYAIVSLPDVKDKNFMIVLGVFENDLSEMVTLYIVTYILEASKKYREGNSLFCVVISF